MFYLDHFGFTTLFVSGFHWGYCSFLALEATDTVGLMMCAYKLRAGYSYKLCKCSLHRTQKNKQVMYYDCLQELRANVALVCTKTMYLQLYKSDIVASFPGSCVWANSHCGTISIPPSLNPSSLSSLFACKLTYKIQWRSSRGLL